MVPERSEDSVSGVAVIGGKLFVSYLHDVRLKIAVFSLDGKALGEVPLPGPVSGGIFGEWDRDEGFLSYQSFTTPAEI